ncbi:MAG: DMT family transporter [Candidatus Bathyarchaeia archaeon]
MDPGVIGESAAVATSFLWTASSIFFTSAGKRIGWLSINAYRTVIAIALLVVTQIILLGTVVPIASLGQWFWMGLSGIVGLGIGDSGLFAAYLTIGPRRALLLMALAPVFAAVGAYLMLGETIPELAMVGIIITLIGVVMVILESEERSGEPLISSRRRTSGVMFGLVAAGGQGVGLVLAKKGIDLIPGITLNPVSATLMRLFLGAFFVWVLTLVLGRIPEVLRAARNMAAMRDTAAASLVGPYLGITFSMVAVTLTETGVAQTLLSLMPVMIIPVVWILYGQRTSWRGIIGAVVAVLGVAIIFIS